MLPSEKEWIQDLLKQRYYTENEESWLDMCERVSTLGRTKDKYYNKRTGKYVKSRAKLHEKLARDIVNKTAAIGLGLETVQQVAGLGTEYEKETE